MSELDKLLDEIGAKIHGEIYDDWEDSGSSVFDPFGKFHDWLKTRLTKFVTVKPVETCKWCRNAHKAQNHDGLIEDYGN